MTTRVPTNERVRGVFWGRVRTGTVVTISKRKGQRRAAIGVVFNDADLPAGLRDRLCWYDRDELEGEPQ